ncbi:uncharacterized protein LOC122084746 [Macadamia integrifolia]|uniref:uncharacterized protein LOC122084746 n=1 Tax=Macadamia integrifolia TaxID=60698 RepID=UPI001C4E5FD8|nr:uncharacterized protein LOC122084746 [Macadamia integrifolia]
MDLKSPKYSQASSLFSYNKINISPLICLLLLSLHSFALIFFLFWFCFRPHMFQGAALESNVSFCNNRNIENSFGDTIPDPLCKLNLRETSEFVKAFPMANNSAESRCVLETPAQRREGKSLVSQRKLEAPPTPGRPVFSFSAGNLPRKSFPSKWDDAEKWVINSSCHDSPSPTLKTLGAPRGGGGSLSPRTEYPAERWYLMDPSWSSLPLSRPISVEGGSPPEGSSSPIFMFDAALVFL